MKFKLTFLDSGRKVDVNLDPRFKLSGGLTTVATDATLTGNGTITDPLSVIGGGGVNGIDTVLAVEQDLTQGRSINTKNQKFEIIGRWPSEATGKIILEKEHQNQRKTFLTIGDCEFFLGACNPNNDISALGIYGYIDKSDTTEKNNVLNIGTSLEGSLRIYDDLGSAGQPGEVFTAVSVDRGTAGFLPTSRWMPSTSSLFEEIEDSYGIGTQRINQQNTVSGIGTTILGGWNNVALSSYSVITGGRYNAISGSAGNCCYSPTPGYCSNFTTILNGQFNEASGYYNTVSGGASNTINDSIGSFIYGGITNQISDTSFSSIIAGSGNSLSGSNSSIISGTNFVGSADNTAYAANIVITKCGGLKVTSGAQPGYVLKAYDFSGSAIWQPDGNFFSTCNDSNAIYKCNSVPNAFCPSIGRIGTTVSGGTNHSVLNDQNGCSAYGTISGGCNNSVSSLFSVISGGFLNQATACNSVISGGGCNITKGGYSVISGGGNNETGTNLYETIGGGYNNTGCAASVTISGGVNNTSYSPKGVIAGGCFNYQFPSGEGNVISGGINNCQFSSCGGILGGILNTIGSSHAKSFIVGSDISSTASCTTHVNCLHISNICRAASAPALPAGTIWIDTSDNSVKII